MASPEFIRQVANANDIVDVIQSYFPLQRSGSGFKALSPFSQERTPSFHVSPAKQAFYCFSTQQGGDVFKFLQLYENISFLEALKKLAERVGIPFEDTGFDPQAAAQQRRLSLLRDLQSQSRDYFHQLLLKSNAAAPARDYLQARGIGIETARQWKLGYAPQNSAEFLQWARDTGFREDALLEGGLARRAEDSPRVYAHFRHRLMFPVANDYGETIAFSGRVLSTDQKGGKYVNSPETPIFQKSKQFFGFDKSKKPILLAGFAILCEGQLDLITAFEAGIQNIVAPLGTAFTENHGRILRRYTGEVVLCFDSDKAGFRAVEKAFATLARTGILVRVAILPPGEDPDSLIRQQGPAAFRDIIAQAPDYFDAQIARKVHNTATASIKDRVEVAESLVAHAALVEDHLKQSLILERISSRLGLPVTGLQRLCQKAAILESRLSQNPRTTTTPDADDPPLPQKNFFPHTQNIKRFCQLLLCSPEAKAWVREKGDRSLLDTVSDTELLALLWDGDFDPADLSSRSLFYRQLPETAQNAASRLLMEHCLSPTEETAQDCHLNLLRQSLHIRSAGLKAKLKSPPESESCLFALLEEFKGLEVQIKSLPPSRTAQDTISSSPLPALALAPPESDFEDGPDSPFLEF